MLEGFLLRLRAAGLPVSITEHLTLMAAMKAGAARYSVEDFYYLSRSALVKDERHYDRFDRVFGAAFKGLDADEGVEAVDLPEEWLRKLAEKILTPEEMAEVQALGGFEALMETLRQRLAEQNERHQGGSKWIGTAGTSPFGAYGYNPEGVRIGQHESRHRRAVKVWDKREFRDYDDTAALAGRNIALALRKLRRFAREGAATELDLPGTVRATADNAGWLDLKLTPERHNAMKLILLLDAGGSMDAHAKATSELFSAVRSEFKHLEQFYFHNCPYENVWRTNAGGRRGKIGTIELLRTYGADYRLVIVGDASMSPYELLAPGGSVEHWNAEAGQVWLGRLTGHFRRSAWLNPEPESHWRYTSSIGLVKQLMGERMYPLSLTGLEAMTGALKH
jgi:uncharacterized protein